MRLLAIVTVVGLILAGSSAQAPGRLVLEWNDGIEESGVQHPALDGGATATCRVTLSTTFLLYH